MPGCPQDAFILVVTRWPPPSGSPRRRASALYRARRRRRAGRRTSGVARGAPLGASGPQRATPPYGPYDVRRSSGSISGWRSARIELLRVAGILEDLPRKKREVLWLTGFEGLGVAQIARALKLHEWYRSISAFAWAVGVREHISRFDESLADFNGHARRPKPIKEELNPSFGAFGCTTRTPR